MSLQLDALITFVLWLDDPRVFLVYTTIFLYFVHRCYLSCMRTICVCASMIHTAIQ